MTARIEELLEEMRNGRMVILVDDEDRENEGDLVLAADFATPDMINFMATHGRGLICLPLEQEQIARLGLPPMARRNRDPYGTAFMVSIEARHGVTTGISTGDRAETIRAAISPNATPDSVVTPGHVFPIAAREGGVLVRAGHTEASIDLARLAGLNPASVICEIMKDDGTMARLADLEAFAEKHGLKIGTIADLIAYRCRQESLIEPVSERMIESRYAGTARLKVFRDRVRGAEHAAMIIGTVRPEDNIPVRVHIQDPLKDILGEGQSGMHQALRTMQAEASGVAVFIQHDGTARLSSPYEAAGNGMDGTNHPVPFRSYGIGAQILREVGVRHMTLLTNSNKKMVGLEGYGLNIAGRRPLGSPELHQQSEEQV